MIRQLASQRGVSLVEALVALLVMAFGMLAVVGVQTTMRSNGDIAKQRSEAVRIAQEAIEQWRGYSTLATTEGQVAFADIQSAAAVRYGPAGSGEGVVAYPTNTVYLLVRTVPEDSPPGMQTVDATVSWVDRDGQTQSVELSTVISRVAPELAGTLAVPAYGSPTRRPQDRNAGIPVGAQQIDGNRSVYRPAGGGSAGSAWVFDNTTGYIVKQCSGPTVAAKATVTMNDLTCSDTTALPISGYVRFGTLLTGRAMPLRMGVDGASATCLDDSPTELGAIGSYVTYVCAVAVSGTPKVWSGRPRVSLCPEEGPCSAQEGGRLTVDDHDYKECRFNPPPGDGYTKVSRPLANQNFAIVREDEDCPT